MTTQEITGYMWSICICVYVSHLSDYAQTFSGKPSNPLNWEMVSADVTTI